MRIKEPTFFPACSPFKSDEIAGRNGTKRQAYGANLKGIVIVEAR
jgi:hypothetical protein